MSRKTYNTAAAASLPGEAPSIEKLPFIGRRSKNETGHPRHFWRVTPTGNYRDDCKTGQAFALQYLAYEEAEKGGPTILAHIVEDMPRDLTGIEIAFLQMVAFAASAGAHKARRIAAYWASCETEDAADLAAVEDLIARHKAAIEEHNRLFALNDRGEASDEAVSDAVTIADEAVIALCAARPVSAEGRARRRDYLMSGVLVETTDSCAGLTKAAYEALLSEGQS